MPDRMPLISGNWKMNHNHFEAIQLIQKLSYALSSDARNTTARAISSGCPARRNGLSCPIL